MFTSDEAKSFQVGWNAEVKFLSRMTVKNLKVVYARNLRERGIEMLYGGPGSKDELVSAILAFNYPIEKLNESIHVLYHTEKWEACELCQAIPPF